MIDLVDGVDSLTRFKRETASFLKKLRKSARPCVLTVNGKAELIVQDTASYQALMERIEMLETAEAVRQSMDEFARGEGRPAAEVLEKLRKKLGVPKSQ